MTGRDRIYLFYCLLIFTVGCGMIAGNGYGRLFLRTDWSQFDRVTQSSLFALRSIFAVLFSMSFLELRKRATLIYTFLKIIIVGHFALADRLRTNHREQWIFEQRNCERCYCNTKLWILRHLNI